MFFWKKNKIIDEFANEVVLEFYSSVNPDTLKSFFQDENDKSSKQTKKDNSKVQDAVDNCIYKVKIFKRNNALGVYGKARIHLKIKVRMMELGYDEVSIDTFNRAVMIKTP